MKKIALLGAGNVGRAFARHIESTSEEHSFRLTAVADVSGGIFLEGVDEMHAVLDQLERGSLIRDFAPRERLHKVPDFIRSLRATGVAVLVECMPTNISDGQPALDYLHAVILQGIPVVTVDKGPLVHGFKKLTEAAQQAGVSLGYTGTTGVRPPSEIAGCRIREIQGALNGTTNYILTQMLERSLAFAYALAEAQKQGVAEPNPSLDTDAWDTACKILILGNRWMAADAALQDVARVGIGPKTESLVRTARAGGRVVRLIGRARAWQEKVQLSVAPELIDSGSPFFPISGTSKGAVFTTEDGAEFFSAGRSGRQEIAQTILEDVQAVAHAPTP